MHQVAIAFIRAMLTCELPLFTNSVLLWL